MADRGYRALSQHRPAGTARSQPDLDLPVRLPQHRHIVVDKHNGIAALQQVTHHSDETLDVGGM